MFSVVVRPEGGTYIPVMVIGIRRHQLAVENYRAEVTRDLRSVSQATAQIKVSAEQAGFGPDCLVISPVDTGTRTATPYHRVP